MDNRIAVISDIHGNLPALESIIKDVEDKKIKRVICLGDTIGLGPNPKECLELIMKNNVDMILGNHELYILHGSSIDEDIKEKEEIRHYEWVKSCLTSDQLDFLKNLDLQIEYDDVLFEHFILDRDLKYPFYNLDMMKNEQFLNQIDKRFIFVGHVHKDIVVKDKLIMVGSSGCTWDENTSYYVLDLDNKLYHKVILKYDRNRFEELLKSKNYPDRKNIAKIFFGIELPDKVNL